MKILVIGSGGRENALVWKIAQSKRVSKIFCAPGNPGTGLFAENINIHPNELEKLADFAFDQKIDMTVVGPEAPLICGIADLFNKKSLPIIGPTAKAARLEGSKVYSKKIMLWNRIPTAKFACFDDYAYASEFLKTRNYPLVIKAEGQCLGKGVKICSDVKSAQKFLKAVMVDKIFKNEGKKVVIEEFLEGQEISFMVATDGSDFISLIPSQDHKRIYDNDLGPNTGGMGAYAPVPFIDKKMIRRIEREIVKPTIDGLRNHGNPYSGILYPGLILTPSGPRVLEYNCRFGDPETQPVLSLLKSDIMDLFEAIHTKNIRKLKLKWKKEFSAGIVLASKGYPGDYEKGKEIFGLDKLKGKKDIQVFHSGTKSEKGKIITSGGRVLCVTSSAKTLRSAINYAYEHIGEKGVNFDGFQYRKDIGKKGLDRKLWKKILKKSG